VRPHDLVRFLETLIEEARRIPGRDERSRAPRRPDASHPSQRDVKHAGGARGLRSRLQMLKPGVATPID
jgi:hypothetical protein